MEFETKALTRATKGGIARAEKLSKRELSESAKKAAEARWGSELPQALPRPDSSSSGWVAAEPLLQLVLHGAYWTADVIPPLAIAR